MRGTVVNTSESVEVSRERLEKGETKEREQRKGKKANITGRAGG